MIRGSCLCGGVRFELDDDALAFISFCHCSICRKTSGAAHANMAHGRASGFRWLAGEGLLARYESSPGVHRTFCRTCGSRTPIVSPEIDSVAVPAGLFDDDPRIRPSLHFFVGSKAPWFDLTDGLPKWDDWPPEEPVR